MDKVTSFSVDIRILSTKGCLPLPRGYIHVEKRKKMCIKIEFKEICLKLATNGQSDKGFLLTSKFVPKGFSALAPGLYTCIKSLKVSIKSDFEEIVLKIATYGQREKAFLLSSKFCPHWIVSPCSGYIHNGETWKKMYIKSDFKAIFLNLQQMGKMIRAFCWHQKFVPKGLSALALGLYTYIKSLKTCIKSDFFFLNLQRMGKSDKGFLLTSKVCPQGVVCPCPGAVYMYKIIKNVYKIRFWRDHFETCNIWAKRKGLSVVIKILSPRACLPLPWGYIHV